MTSKELSRETVHLMQYLGDPPFLNVVTHELNKFVLPFIVARSEPPQTPSFCSLPTTPQLATSGLRPDSISSDTRPGEDR
jgi:hypothetical protein